MIELNELRDSAQKAFPADQLIPAREESWKLIAEMGWLMIELPEEDGGLGLGPDATATVLYELGRVLSGAPIIPQLLTLRAIAASTRLADRANWIERLCGGEYVPLNILPSSIDIATSGDGAHTLSGLLPGVPDADMAGHILICANGLYALAPIDAPGISVVENKLWDQSRRLFDIRLDGYTVDPALVIAQGDVERLPIELRLYSGILLMLAADSLGGAAAALDMTVEYLKTRKQFERPLAMFQALKHRCADLKTHVVAAEALLWERAANRDATPIDLGALKALATDVYRIVVEEAIQLHGGIGLTEEHQCHLFMKRAMLNLQLGGSLDVHREQTGRAALAALAA